MRKYLIPFVLMAAATAAMIDPTPVQANVDVTRAVNQYRAQKGAHPLRYSPQLEQAARRHATDMARGGFLSHHGSNGSTPSHRVQAQGYGWCFVAENVARGQGSLAEVMRDWARSPGHARNLFSHKARDFALVRSEGQLWVMVLAAPGC